MNTSTVSNSPSPTLAAAKEAANDLKGKVASSTESLKSTALDRAASQKADAADKVERMSGALHQTADGMAENDPNIAHFAHRVADRIDGASQYLRNRSLSALKDDACRVAHDHPVAFFGGLFAAGLVLGSLIKAGVSESSGNAGLQDNALGSPTRSDSTAASDAQPA